MNGKVNNQDGTYNYANSTMSSADTHNGLPSSLYGENNISDTLMNAHGIYSRKDIDLARFRQYSRFGRVLDPYGKVNGGREYLFFVKPDLHICKRTFQGLDVSNGVYKISPGIASPYSANGMTLNPQLDNHPYFKGLLDTNPDTLKELQSGLITSASYTDPFSHLLSFTVNSTLPLDSSSSKTVDNPSTIFNTNYNYLMDSEDSDEAYQFSLEFVDNKYLDTYHFFKAYSEYHIARKYGFITPPHADYYRYKRLHNTMGIYKFVVGEDMETIIYWAYLWGVIPTSCPRDAFQDPSNMMDGLTFSVNFEAAFIEDMNPMILYQFNKLMQPVLKKYGCNIDFWLPVVKQNMFRDDIAGLNENVHAAYRSYDTSLGYKGEGDLVNSPTSFSEINQLDELSSAEKQKLKDTLPNFNYNIGPTEHIDGRLPVAALVDNRTLPSDSRKKYRLRWYPIPSSYSG